MERIYPMADTINITRTCPSCASPIALTVPAAGFAAWDLGRGAFVHDAFPDLTDGQREILVSGLCETCSGRLFAELETDVGDTGPTPDGKSVGNPDSPTANPGASGVTHIHAAGETRGGATVAGPTPQECADRALLGLTAEGEPATRGHLRAPSLDWPRCTTEIPGLESPIFLTPPNLCNRPATLLMGFTADYLHSMRNHRCDDPGCPIEELGRDEGALAELHVKHVPLCAMHLPTLRDAERQWVTDVGRAEGVTHAFDVAVIGVESVSLLGGGHPDGAQVIDLRPLTGVRLP
jgi:hypothetical protein